MATNVRVNDDTHTRLTEIQPFDSISMDETINELIDGYTGDRLDAAGGEGT